MKAVIRFLLAGALSFAFFQADYCMASEKKMEDAEKVQNEDPIEVSKVTFTNVGERPCGKVTEAEKNTAEAMVKYLRAHGMTIKGVRFITDTPKDKVDWKSVIDGFVIEDSDEFKKQISEVFQYGVENSAVFRRLLLSLPAGLNIMEGKRSCVKKGENGQIEVYISLDQIDDFKYNTPFALSDLRSDELNRYEFSIENKKLNRLYVLYHELSHVKRKQITQDLGIPTSLKKGSKNGKDTMNAISNLFDFSKVRNDDIEVSPLLANIIRSLKECHKCFFYFPHKVYISPKFYHIKKKISFDEVENCYRKKVKELRSDKSKLAEILFDTVEEVNQVEGIAVYNDFLYVRPSCDVAFFAEQNLPIRTDHKVSGVKIFRMKKVIDEGSKYLLACCELIGRLKKSLEKLNERDNPKLQEEEGSALLEKLISLTDEIRHMNIITEDIKVEDVKRMEKALEKGHKLIEEIISKDIFSEELVDSLEEKVEEYGRFILFDRYETMMERCPGYFIDVRNLTFNKEFLSLLLKLHGMNVNNVDAYGLALDISILGEKCKSHNLSVPLALTYDSSSTKDENEEKCTDVCVSSQKNETVK